MPECLTRGRNKFLHKNGEASFLHLELHTTFGKFISNLENILGRRKDTLNVLYIFKKKKKAKGRVGGKEVQETYYII